MANLYDTPLVNLRVQLAAHQAELTKQQTNVDSYRNALRTYIANREAQKALVASYTKAIELLEAENHHVPGTPKSDDEDDDTDGD
jgi:hypothetical protein